MNNLYARSVFFVTDAERSLRFYTEQLGFSVDWKFPEEGPTFVFQVRLFGFELILNQIEERTQARAGHGRVFIGLDDDQIEPLHKHVAANGIQTERLDWGRPTLVVRDLDGNELFFWDTPDKGMPALEPSGITEPMKWEAAAPALWYRPPTRACSGRARGVPSSEVAAPRGGRR